MRHADSTDAPRPGRPPRCAAARRRRRGPGARTDRARRAGAVRAPSAPTPEPPLSATCERLPLGSATYTCKDEASAFYGDVVDAIATLQLERPEYFRGDIVTNEGGYYAGLIRILDRSRLCAAFDGEELAVKSGPEYSEQFKVLTSWGQVRRDYKGVCFPPSFPSRGLCRRPRRPAARSPRARSPPAAGGTRGSWPTSRPPSTGSSWRSRSSSTSAGRRRAATGRSCATSMPTSGRSSRRSPRRGYCGLLDGEEVQVKRSNEFSEHYDLNLSDRYVRRGPGAFRGSCYPAAF